VIDWSFVEVESEVLVEALLLAVLVLEVAALGVLRDDEDGLHEALAVVFGDQV
jgi:hypothetical protein